MSGTGLMEIEKLKDTLERAGYVSEISFKKFAYDAAKGLYLCADPAEQEGGYVERLRAKTDIVIVPTTNKILEDVFKGVIDYSKGKYGFNGEILYNTKSQWDGIEVESLSVTFKLEQVRPMLYSLEDCRDWLKEYSEKIEVKSVELARETIERGQSHREGQLGDVGDV